jgi:hypothetical protein
MQTNTPAAVPDTDIQLVRALKERGASSYMLEHFARRLRSRPPDSDLPCPFCFGLGRDSPLIEQTRMGQILTFRCHTCGEQVLLTNK